MTTSQGLAGSVSEYCRGRRAAADGAAGAPVGVVAADGGAVAEPVAGADGGADAVAVGAVEVDPVGDTVPDEAPGDPDAVGSAGVVPVVVAGEGWGPAGVQAASADSPAPAKSSRAMTRRLGAETRLSAGRSGPGEQS
ncbi:hypothetical protein J2809_000364 [Arthrobacter pascens]|uniref:hypothetical protein n=1 Tax=Arthrobacter pascens TaxID=1677 RepID=UPI00285B5A5A|nr:hypothetical protein [Arthrobacter pascens]